MNFRGSARTARAPGPRTARNRTQRQRLEARQQITALLVAQHHRCHWCGEPIIDPATVPATQVVTATGDWLVWRRAGRVKPVERRVATIDHVIPIREGGTNIRTNLVAACGQCNRKRTAPRSPRTMTERWTCPKCGQRKEDYHRRKCFKCRLGAGFRPDVTDYS